MQVKELQHLAGNVALFWVGRECMLTSTAQYMLGKDVVVRMRGYLALEFCHEEKLK
jgi:hypothetical protein